MNLATTPRLRIGFLLAPRFTLSAFATFVDVLRLAADDGDGSRPIRCRWTVLSRDMTPIQSSCGIKIQPEEPLGDPSRFDYIVTVGGLIDPATTLSPEAAAFLKRAAEARVSLAGICTGVFALARCGLMDGYRSCVSWFHHEDFLSEFEKMRPVSDQIFVVDRDRLSCSGGVSAAHLAAFLVDRHIGRAAARSAVDPDDRRGFDRRPSAAGPAAGADGARSFGAPCAARNAAKPPCAAVHCANCPRSRRRTAQTGAAFQR
ncbi:AraC family transcriptional regulator [Paracoccus cavernae]|uniref:AraC family transcriptional regulator n=1 Tax=Paracoccus cavernae TaxID=1571207 RepID=UPI00362C3E50